jgi:hypothetical protein
LLRLGVEKFVADSSVPLDELLDLKMMPAWVNETETAPAERYAHVDGEERSERGRGRPRPKGGENRKPSTFNKGRPGADRPGSRPNKRDRPHERGRPQRDGRNRPAFGKGSGAPRNRESRSPTVEQVVPKVEVRFLPRSAALENVIAQIKENSFAYSLFALARLFLAKPERYDVRLTAAAETPLFQLGENGALSANREFLDRSAFRLAQSDFYKIDITESEPIKGNFTSIARDRLSGTVLGPTNHHDYQKRLRGLYEQRFSRRMNFADYQRQVEIVNDPQMVEQWKEDARKITTYSTSKEGTPVTFASVAETERHFREKYLPELIRTVTESAVDGLTSRKLTDRVLFRLVENEWTTETRSPSRMMQELATQFRQSGLHVFRHRRGMLFVSPIRTRPLVLEGAAVSPSVKSIIETLSAQPGTKRKDLADKLLVDLAGEESERAKLTLAADLHWLVSEGHVIEFNDGSLDLPRVKVKQPQKENVEAGVPGAENSSQEPVETSVPAADTPTEDAPKAEVSVVAAVASTAEGCRASVPDANSDGVSQKRPTILEEEEAEIGGS